MGRSSGFREVVVPPRPVAHFPRTFAVASLGTATLLSATLIGTFQMGMVAGPSGHDTGRIMGMPLTPSSTFPFFAFGETRPANTNPSATKAGDVTAMSHPEASVAAAAVHAPSTAGVPHQGVTLVSAVLRTPRTESAMQVVSVFSTYTVATVASAPKPANLVKVLPQRQRDRALEASEHETRNGQKAKAPKTHKAHRHAQAPKDTTPAKATRNV